MKYRFNRAKPFSTLSRSLLLLLCTGVTAGVSAMPPAQTLQPQDFAELEQAIASIKTEGGLPFGSAIALVHNGKLIYQHHSGYADIQRRQAVTRDTAFYIASATKPFTALAFLLLAQQGKVNLEQSLQQMWPKLQFQSVDASRITLRQLLTHQSGLDNQPLVWASAYSGIHSMESMTQLVAASVPDPEAKLGEFRYGNIGYNIAGLWLDQTSGMAWQDQLQQLIFDPLKMQHSSARQSKAAQWPLALPYSLMKTAEPLYLQKTDATMHAAGGMFATSGDLATTLPYRSMCFSRWSRSWASDMSDGSRVTRGSCSGTTGAHPASEPHSFAPRDHVLPSSTYTRRNSNAPYNVVLILAFVTPMS